MKIHFIIILSLFFTVSAAAQSASEQARPQNSYSLEEKFPTSRNPRYVPSIIPPKLRKQLQPGSETIFTPSGEVDMEKFMEMQKSKKKKTQLNRYMEQRSEDLIEKDEYRYMEKRLADQFGVNEFPLGEREDTYEETSSRRFQIVFFTSLPITLGISYGIVSTSTRSRVFNGPQTAGIGILGIAASALIAWYDHVQWKKDMAASRFLDERDQKNLYLAQNIQMKMEDSEPSEALPRKSDGHNILGFSVTLPLRR